MTMNRDEIKRLYLMLEELNDFFHQPDNFSSEKVQEFAERIYPEIKEMYYETVWNQLPTDLRDELENR